MAKYKLDSKKKVYMGLCKFFDEIDQHDIWSDKKYSVLPNNPKEIETINEWLRGENGIRFHNFGDKIDLREKEGQHIWMKYLAEFEVLRTVIDSENETFYYGEKEKNNLNFYRSLFIS